MFGWTYASSSCFTPKTESEKYLAPALDKMQRICTLLPGDRFCIDVEEGHMVITVAWTPRANESKLTSRYYFRFNVLTEQTEYAEREESSFHLTYIYRKVDKRALNTLSLNAPAACEQKLAAFGLINMDEFDRLPASKMPLLKNLMQMSALNIRKAYRQSHEPLRRIASFIGTSNLETLLADRTGSRRFLCVKLEHPIDCAAPIDHAQLYAQLKEELLQGEATGSVRKRKPPSGATTSSSTSTCPRKSCSTAFSVSPRRTTGRRMYGRSTPPRYSRR